MKTFRLYSSAVVVVLCTLAFASVAEAQATRTWVSGVGDDANPCSRTAPCKTFAGAISKTAAGGEINALDDGGFGAVTITKSVTIDAGNHIGGVLAALTTGIIVNAAAGDVVTLRNLDINGAGTGLFGIRIFGAKAVHIEHCQIYKFRSGSGRGISDERAGSPASGPTLFVDDTYLTDNLNGIAIVGNPTSTVIRAFIRQSRIQNNSGFGILGSNSANVIVESSNISENAGDGFKVDSNAFGSIIGCVFVRNTGTAILNSGGSSIFLADNTVFNNTTGFSGTVVTFGNNNFRNNAGGNTLPVTVGQQ